MIAAEAADARPAQRGPCTLSADCGGTGMKACVLDADGTMVSERVRVPTPYPCPPEVLLSTLEDLRRRLPPAERASIGVPGAVRDGIVLATPHFVTESGPFTPRRPDLVEAWAGFDLASAAAATLGLPTRVANDAELQALAVVDGKGYEVVITLGTGMGFAQIWDNVLLPKVELSQHRFRKGESYDRQLGNSARVAVGNAKWSRRVLRAIEGLRVVFWWDRLFLGGGNTRYLNEWARGELGDDVQIVPNLAGLLGGARLWGVDHLRSALP